MPRGALLPSLLRYLRAGLPLSACARQPSLSTCILEERSRKEGERVDMSMIDTYLRTMERYIVAVCGQIWCGRPRAL